MVHAELRGQGRELLRRIRWRRWRETSIRLREKLGIGFRLREAQAEQCGRRRGYAVEKARIGKRLGDTDVRAAKSWNVARDAKTEVIVEEAKAATRDSFRGYLPSEADPW